jgi:dihydrofolate synthase/folylpolyglutamate synthase
MNYPESVRFLYALGNEIRTAKLGLERIARLLEGLGSPQRHGRFVHVAGTNGKGSVCAMIESSLRAAGVRTGLFTSPHLSEPTERIQIDGRPVSAAQFAEAFDQVHGAAERMLADGAMDLHPTYFETVVAMALLTFRDTNVDTAVLEVGLGGRLDATNIVEPAISVITPVDYDHEAFLGKSIEAIALEKAGIIKRGVPVVVAAQRPEVAAILERRAAELGAPVLRAGAWTVEQSESHAHGNRFRVSGPASLRIECPLAGEHQIANALTAIAALHTLGIPAAAVEAGIRNTRWPGRLEFVAERPDIVLDGAHNPSGARSLAAYIDRFHSGRRVWLIYGAMRDKAVSEMTGILFPHAGEIILTAPRQPRALRPEAIASMVDHRAMRTAPDLETALALFRKQGAPDDIAFVTGSLFLVGEARALLVPPPNRLTGQPPNRTTEQPANRLTEQPCSTSSLTR